MAQKCKSDRSFNEVSKYFFIFLFGVIFTVSFYSCQMRQTANIDSEGKNIICFGDSLTFGYNVESKDSYPSVLSKMLGKNIINSGRNADTVTLALDRLEKDVLEKDPLLVIVILGANDFLQRIPKNQTLEHLEIIITKIKAKGAMVALGQLGPFSMYIYKKDYKKLAESENIILINDILGGVFGKPDFMSDDVHPNAKGYVKIAEKVYKAIAPILEKNRKLRGEYD